MRRSGSEVHLLRARNPSAGVVGALLTGLFAAEVAGVVRKLKGTFRQRPAVDVTPDGPTYACEGQGLMLTAAPTGGSSLSYQWTRDGVAVGGGGTGSTGGLS